MSLGYWIFRHVKSIHYYIKNDTSLLRNPTVVEKVVHDEVQHASREKYPLTSYTEKYFNMNFQKVWVINTESSCQIEIFQAERRYKHICLPIIIVEHVTHLLVTFDVGLHAQQWILPMNKSLGYEIFPMWNQYFAQ